MDVETPCDTIPNSFVSSWNRGESGTSFPKQVLGLLDYDDVKDIVRWIFDEDSCASFCMVEGEEIWK